MFVCGQFDYIRSRKPAEIRGQRFGPAFLLAFFARAQMRDHRAVGPRQRMRGIDLRRAGQCFFGVCELIVVDRRDFLSLVSKDPRIALGMITLLCARLRWAGQQFEEVVFLNLPGRLAKLLVRLAGKAKGSPPPHKLAITQRELSLLTGTSRESVNKQLRTWAKNKWIRVERGGIVVLVPDAIEAIARSGAPRET